MSVFDDHKKGKARIHDGARSLTPGCDHGFTDGLILVGQHGVYGTSNRNSSKSSMDLQSVLSSINGAKELVSSVMEELRLQREKTG